MLLALAACLTYDSSAAPTLPPPSVATVIVARDTATLVPNTTVQLSVSLFDEGGHKLTRPVSWTTSDPTRATVSATGLVTGLSAGSAVVTATSEAASGSAAITIK